ncbi:hypothetical protein R3X27_06795 [Tropicimonas sp. TH_r6]|uniref:hypothetical protein n=1 Tax=Tropicimonas sp. TH_r6 TaxID=3082085 RepID=UPI002954193A|nr:hypothetical protein [Tropicimonas sp. TH_r6]MDV7142386.1 hypothetical protein [Tropicimonas sp. TH_r6]
MTTEKWIEIRGLRFPDSPQFLTEPARNDLEQASRNDGLARKLSSLAKPSDRAIVTGAGSGLAPAFLAGRIGLRHVHIVEPDRNRQAYLRRVQQANGLFRISISETALPPFEPSFLVADLTLTGGALPEDTLQPDLRGAVLRLPDDFASISRVLPQLMDAGLYYFPRQSSGNLVCFLRKWN